MRTTNRRPFSLTLPSSDKLRGQQLRWFFKEALRGFLPDEIIMKKKHGFERRQIAINTSHTHCGPVVGRTLGAMYSISDAQWKQVDDYRAVLLDKLVDVVDKAVADLAPGPCRYVRLEFQPRGWLMLDEVEVFGKADR